MVQLLFEQLVTRIPSLIEVMVSNSADTVTLNVLDRMHPHSWLSYYANEYGFDQVRGNPGVIFSKEFDISKKDKFPRSTI